jgi:hypothetical protein
MFIAVRINITDNQGSRVCLMNTSEHSLRSGLACANDGGDIFPEKVYLSEAGHVCWMPGEALVTAG